MKKTSLLTFMLYVLAAVFIFATEYYLAFSRLNTQVYYENEFTIHLFIQPIATAIFTIIICAMGNWPRWLCPIFMIGAGAMVYGVTDWLAYLLIFGVPSVAALLLYFLIRQINIVTDAYAEKLLQRKDN